MIKIINNDLLYSIPLHFLYNINGYPESKFNDMTIFQRVILYEGIVEYKIANEYLLHIVCL